MGVTVDSIGILETTPTTPHANPSPDSSTHEVTLPPREVVRCQGCSLVQFRTQSDLCRRCHKDLPNPLKEAALRAAAQKELDNVEFDEFDNFEYFDDSGLGRAARNRKVAVGKKLRTCRENMGLTQVEMSEKLEIPRTYLSRIENDRLLPGPLMLSRFAEMLEIDVSELLPMFRGAKMNGVNPFVDPIGSQLLDAFTGLGLQEMNEVLDAARRMRVSKVLQMPQRPVPVEQPVRLVYSRLS